MTADWEILELAGRVGHRLLAAHCRLATAESCTAGWISKAVTDIAGSSRWFECGYAVYSNAAKVRDLGVSALTLDRYGAVSEEVVQEMAHGALRVSGAEVAVAVSGIAGPDGGTPEKPVGTVWHCIAVRVGRTIERHSQARHFDGDREAVRRQTVTHALQLLLRIELPIVPSTPSVRRVPPMG